MPSGWSPSPRQRRAVIKAQLRRGQRPTDDGVVFLRNNPEEWEKLQDSLSGSEKAELSEALADLALQLKPKEEYCN